MHGVQSGVRYSDGQVNLFVETLDAAIVVPGELTPFPTPFALPRKKFFMNLFFCVKISQLRMVQ